MSVLFMHMGQVETHLEELALLYLRSRWLQASLCEFFIVVVQICHNVLKYSQKSYPAQLVSKMSDGDIKRFQTELEMRTIEVKKAVDFLRENTLTVLTETPTFLQRRQYFQQDSDILNACSTFDYQTLWEKTRQSGKTARYKEFIEYDLWKWGGSSGTLVVSGKLGSGKSVTMANIVDDLTIEQPGKQPIAYFFCRRDFTTSLQPRTVVGSLIRQLLSAIPSFELPPTSLADKRDAELRKLLTSLLCIPVPWRTGYIVLDGLDECTLSDQKEILSYCDVIQRKLHLKLCISSRQRRDITFHPSYNRFNSFCIFIPPEYNPDILPFIDNELKTELSKGNLVLGDPEIIHEIQDVLYRGSQGMFLWAALQIQALCKARSDKEIRQVLQSVPQTLSDTYSRILKAPTSVPSHKEIQRTTLQLLAVSARPLKLEEFQEALGVTIGHTHWDPKKPNTDIHWALSLCGPLVTVNEEDKTVHLLHPSLRQFLFEPQYDAEFDIEDAKMHMARIVLTYLSYDTLTIADSDPSRSISKLKGMKEGFPFYDYAKTFWPIHTISISESDGFSYQALVRVMENYQPLDVPSKPKLVRKYSFFTVYRAIELSHLLSYAIS